MFARSGRLIGVMDMQGLRFASISLRSDIAQPSGSCFIWFFLSVSTAFLVMNTDATGEARKPDHVSGFPYFGKMSRIGICFTSHLFSSFIE